MPGTATMEKQPVNIVAFATKFSEIWLIHTRANPKTPKKGQSHHRKWKQNNIHQLRLENWYFDLIDEGRQHIFQGYTVYTSAWISDGQRGNEKWNIYLRIEFENCLPNIFFSFSVCSSALGIKEGKMSRKEEKRKNFLKPWGTFQPITNMAAAAALLRVFKKTWVCVCVMSKATLLWFPIFECTDTHPKFLLATQTDKSVFHKNVSRRCLNRNQDTKHNEAWPPHFNVVGKSFFKYKSLVRNVFSSLKRRKKIKDIIIPNKGRPNQNTTEGGQIRKNAKIAGTVWWGSWVLCFNQHFSRSKRGGGRILWISRKHQTTHGRSSCGAFTTHIRCTSTQHKTRPNLSSSTTWQNQFFKFTTILVGRSYLVTYLKGGVWSPRTLFRLFPPFNN